MASKGDLRGLDPGGNATGLAVTAEKLNAYNASVAERGRPEIVESGDVPAWTSEARDETGPDRVAVRHHDRNRLRCQLRGLGSVVIRRHDHVDLAIADLDENLAELVGRLETGVVDRYGRSENIA